MFGNHFTIRVLLEAARSQGSALARTGGGGDIPATRIGVSGDSMRRSEGGMSSTDHEAAKAASTEDTPLMSYDSVFTYGVSPTDSSRQRRTLLVTVASTS